MTYHSNGYVYAYINGGSNHTAASINNNQWSHVVETYDGNNIKLYINGQLANQKALTGSIINTSYEFKIGKNTSYFPGLIEDVAIYNTALSTDEISQIYNGGRTTAVNPQVVAVDASGDEYLGNNLGDSQDWIEVGNSLRTNKSGSKVEYSTETATEIWAGLTYSSAGGIIKAVVDQGTDYEVVNYIDTYSEVTQTEQKTLVAAGLRNVTHTVELELIERKNVKRESWTCGDTVNYEGQDYATVQIDNQCWFAENLNAGTMLASGPTEPSDD